MIYLNSASTTHFIHYSPICLRVLVIVLLSLVCADSSAQDMPQLIFDFNNGTFQANEYFEGGKLRPQQFGGFATIKIINVNTFRWKVEIDGRSINYITPIPSELQTIFRLTDTGEDQQKTEEGLKDIKSAVPPMKEISEEMKVKDQESDKKEGKVAIAAGNADQLERARENFTKAMEELVDACTEYVKIADKIGEIKFTRTQLINLSKQKWESYSAMSNELPPPMAESEMKDTYKQFSTYFAQSAALYNKAEAAAAVYKNLVDPAVQGGVQAQLDAIKKASLDLEKGHEYLYEDNFLKLIEDVLVLQDAMDNENYFTVISPPIQMDGDFVFFNIKTTPAKTNDLMPYEFARTFPVEIPIKGGLKVDFSVGPMFSFGDNARDQKFFLEPIGTDGTNVTLRERSNNNAISPGLAAMMHFYRRAGRNVNIGCLFGVGAGFQSIDDANLSFYFGPSVVLGKREKLMLNLGISYLSVDRLKNGQFIIDNEYASSLSVSDVTEKVIKPSFFLGVSYNLTNRIDVK